MNPVDAARAVVYDYPGGSESLAPRLGKAPSTLRNEVCPPPGIKAKLGLMDAAAISLIAQDPRIVHAFNETCGFCPPLRLPEGHEELGDGTMRDLLGRGAQLSAAVADAFTEFQRDLADGEVTPNELSKFEGAALTAMAALTFLAHAMRAKMEADQRSHLDKVTTLARSAA